MKKHDFAYFFQEGMHDLRSHGFMTFAAVGVTAVCLLLMGTFLLTALNISANLDDLEKTNEILAFVDESYTDAEARAVETRLRAIPNVSAARFITREEALETFQDEHPGEDLFQDLDPEIFRDRYAVQIEDLSGVSETVSRLEAVEGVDGVRVYEELASGFLTVRSVSALVGAALIGLLFLSSLFIVANTVRLATLDRREEIAIMRIVGATNAFIRWPFVYEGFLMGISGAVIAFLLLWGMYALVAGGVADSDSLSLFRVIPFGQVALPTAGSFLLIGLLTGIGGSLSAIRRFLDV